ncbi:MAG TPA: HAMP domain-containing sensor histidine kinase [Methylomirabilota bacterium]|nr:HAMP domain-containing sensor histidine kinase [Methylomirabilota bacterium]
MESATVAAPGLFTRTRSLTRSLLPRGGLLPADAWQRRHQAIVALLWIHAVVIAGIVLVRGYSIGHTAFEGGIVALAAIAASIPRLDQRTRALAATFGLFSSSAILIHLFGGYIEVHFHFFVMIIVISLYQDWWPFLLAVGYVVFHHGVIGVIDPASVYNHPDAVAAPWLWAGIHGAFILAASLASMAAWRLNEDATLARLQAEQRARAAAEAGVKTREEFMAIAAHELRTPAASIKGYAQLALRRAQVEGERGQDTRLRGPLESLVVQTDRLTRLVGQLLETSRLDGGQLKLELAETDLAALVGTEVENARQRSAVHQFTVIAPPRISASVDADRMGQVLINLLDNAIRYSPDGGTITVTLAADANGTLLQVADEGIGIDPARAALIFDRFYQAHAERRYGGMGLGLFISRGIVERHGGAISARPRAEGGTVFEIRLPR